MTAYRFCRSDDLALLADAHERCRGPEDAGAPPLDRAGMKGLIRDIDLWIAHVATCASVAELLLLRSS